MGTIINDKGKRKCRTAWIGMILLNHIMIKLHYD